MELLMSARADATFGIAESDRPQSMWNSSGFVPVPSITGPRTFQGDSATVALGHLNESTELQWSSDGGLHWRSGDTSLVLTETTDLLVRAILNGDTSVVVSHRVLRVDHQWHLSLATPPNNQYTREAIKRRSMDCKRSRFQNWGMAGILGRTLRGHVGLGSSEENHPHRNQCTARHQTLDMESKARELLCVERR